MIVWFSFYFQENREAMLCIKGIYIGKLTFFHWTSFISEYFKVIFWCWMLEYFFPWLFFTFFFIIFCDVLIPVYDFWSFEWFFEEFFDSFFPSFDSDNPILMSRALIHTFDDFCFWNLKLDRFEEVLSIIVMISDLATSRNFVHILSAMSSAGDIVNCNILTSVLDDFVDTFAEIIWYFLKPHDDSMPYMRLKCKFLT